ncbi:DJ-1/PfpI family protein [Luedemannella flava]
MVGHLNRIDHALAVAVAAGVGVVAPTDRHANHGRVSPALSQAARPGGGSIAGRKVAALVADGVAAASLETTRAALTGAGAVVELLAPTDGAVTTASGDPLAVDHAMNTTGSVLYDAVIVADGVAGLVNDGFAVHFVAEAYKHAKPLAVLGTGDTVVEAARLPVFEASDRATEPASKPMAGALDGVLFVAPGADADAAFLDGFIDAIARHRHYDRPVDGIAA